MCKFQPSFGFHRLFWCKICFLRLTCFFTLPDGYTVEDIVLYWEGNGNAIQGTEKLHIPQFSFLGKTVTSKEVFLYTGWSDILSYVFSLLHPGKLLDISLPLTSTLCCLLSYFLLSLDTFQNPFQNEEMGVEALGRV